MKPVAWIINGHLFEEYFRTSELDKIIPLYPSPRELSDEEILEVSHTMPYADRFDFARAILKKASEDV